MMKLGTGAGRVAVFQASGMQHAGNGRDGGHALNEQFDKGFWQEKAAAERLSKRCYERRIDAACRGSAANRTGIFITISMTNQPSVGAL